MSSGIMGKFRPEYRSGYRPEYPAKYPVKYPTDFHGISGGISAECQSLAIHACFILRGYFGKKFREKSDRTPDVDIRRIFRRIFSSRVDRDRMFVRSQQTLRWRPRLRRDHRGVRQGLGRTPVVRGLVGKWPRTTGVRHFQHTDWWVPRHSLERRGKMILDVVPTI